MGKISISIGRDPRANQVVLGDKSVSGRHALLVWDEASRTGDIKDLNSTNGTAVNGEKIGSTVSVKGSDRIKMGLVERTVAELVAESQKTKINPSAAVGHANGKQKRIGRDTGMDIRVPDRYDSVSRKHAVIGQAADGSIVIEDCGSSNGTWVNGEPVGKTRVLKKGDHVRLGRDYTLEWEHLFSGGRTPSKWGGIIKNHGAKIVGAAALIVALIVWPGREMDTKAIYDKYHGAVCMVYLTSRWTVGTKRNNSTTRCSAYTCGCSKAGSVR